MEGLGPHPGYAEVRVRLHVYNAALQREVKLPDKGIDLLIGSIGDVDTALKVMRKALDDWVKGYIIP